MSWVYRALGVSVLIGLLALGYPKQSPEESCGPYEIPMSATLNRVLRSIAP